MLEPEHTHCSEQFWVSAQTLRNKLLVLFTGRVREDIVVQLVFFFFFTELDSSHFLIPALFFATHMRAHAHLILCLSVALPPQIEHDLLATRPLRESCVR